MFVKNFNFLESSIKFCFGRRAFRFALWNRATATADVRPSSSSLSSSSAVVVVAVTTTQSNVFDDYYDGHRTEYSRHPPTLSRRHRPTPSILSSSLSPLPHSLYPPESRGALRRSEFDKLVINIPCQLYTLNVDRPMSHRDPRAAPYRFCKVKMHKFSGNKSSMQISCALAEIPRLSFLHTTTLCGSGEATQQWNSPSSLWLPVCPIPRALRQIDILSREITGNNYSTTNPVNPISFFGSTRCLDFPQSQH